MTLEEQNQPPVSRDQLKRIIGKVASLRDQGGELTPRAKEILFKFKDANKQEWNQAVGDYLEESKVKQQFDPEEAKRATQTNFAVDLNNYLEESERTDFKLDYPDYAKRQTSEVKSVEANSPSKAQQLSDEIDAIFQETKARYSQPVAPKMPDRS